MDYLKLNGLDDPIYVRYDTDTSFATKLEIDFKTACDDMTGRGIGSRKLIYVHKSFNKDAWFCMIQSSDFSILESQARLSLIPHNVVSRYYWVIFPDGQYGYNFSKSFLQFNTAEDAIQFKLTYGHLSN